MAPSLQASTIAADSVARHRFLSFPSPEILSRILEAGSPGRSPPGRSPRTRRTAASPRTLASCDPPEQTARVEERESVSHFLAETVTAGLSSYLGPHAGLPEHLPHIRLGHGLGLVWLCWNPPPKPETLVLVLVGMRFSQVRRDEFVVNSKSTREDCYSVGTAKRPPSPRTPFASLSRRLSSRYHRPRRDRTTPRTLLFLRGVG